MWDNTDTQWLIKLITVELISPLVISRTAPQGLAPTNSAACKQRDIQFPLIFGALLARIAARNCF